MTSFDPKLIAQAQKTKGYLLKKSTSIFTSWKKRYFLFFENGLCSFEDESLEIPRKSLCFDEIIAISPSHLLEFEIKTLTRTYTMKANSIQDQELWVASLNILRENYFTQKKKSQKASIPSRLYRDFSQLKKSNSAELHKFVEKSSQKENVSFMRQRQLKEYFCSQKQLNRLFQMIGQKFSPELTGSEMLFRRFFYLQNYHGIYFCVCPKPIYLMWADSELLSEEQLYPIQLNMLYFVSNLFIKSRRGSHNSFLESAEVCRVEEILECYIVEQKAIRLEIDCQKSIEIEISNMSQQQVNLNLMVNCIKKAISIGKQCSSLNGKLEKNIDLFVKKFEDSDRSELLFYKLVEEEFMGCLERQKEQHSNYSAQFLAQFKSVTVNLRNFMDACLIREPVLTELKDKFAKLYHKFVYGWLSKSWESLYKNLSSSGLIALTSYVYLYYHILLPVYNDSKVKEGCKSLIRIILKKYENQISQFVFNFNNLDEEALRIMKTCELEQHQQTVSESFFFSTFVNNFSTIMVSHFEEIAFQVPKSDEMCCIIWQSIQKYTKTVFEELQHICEKVQQRSSLICVCNSIKELKDRKINELFKKLQKSNLFFIKKDKDGFLKQLNYEMGQVENYCVKKLFVTSFRCIDRQILKLQVPDMDFALICQIVISEIQKFKYILPSVRVTMNEAAFEQVCFFFYICVVKFQNKTLTKEESLKMLNDKLTCIKKSFQERVDQEKVYQLLKDLNYLKQFVSSPTSHLKGITREIKRTFGSSFSEVALKNLISLRTDQRDDQQFLFEECREELKSSYNSQQEMDSFQRQTFLNSSYQRERKSTLTESLQEYCEQFDRASSSGKNKTERVMLLGFLNSIKEGYLYRKRLIKNIGTSYSKYFFRVSKGKIEEFDREESEEVLNCYDLNQLKKCYVEPQKGDTICLQFQKEAIKVKTINKEDAASWIQKILQAIEDCKALQEFSVDQNEGPEDGNNLFQDFEKKVTTQTKETGRSSPSEKHTKKSFKNLTPDQIRVNSKAKNTVGRSHLSINSPSKRVNQSVSRNKYSPKKSVREKQPRAIEPKPNKPKSGKGCGTGCNFL